MNEKGICLLMLNLKKNLSLIFIAALLVSCSSKDTIEGYMTFLLLFDDGNSNAPTDDKYSQTSFQLTHSDGRSYEIYTSEETVWIDSEKQVVSSAHLGEDYRYRITGKIHELDLPNPAYINADEILFLGEFDDDTEPAAPQKIEIMITPVGDFSINGNKVSDSSLATLISAIEDASKKDSDLPVLIRANVNVPQQFVITAMDAVNQLGFSEVSISPGEL